MAASWSCFGFASCFLVPLTDRIWVPPSRQAVQGQRAAGGRGAPPSLSQAWGRADQRGVILQPAFPKGLSHPSAESGGRGPSAVQGRASPRRGGRLAGRGLGHRLSFPSPLPRASVPTPPLPTALPWCARGPGGGGPDVGGARSRRPATCSPSPPGGGRRWSPPALHRGSCARTGVSVCCWR